MTPQILFWDIDKLKAPIDGNVDSCCRGEGYRVVPISGSMQRDTPGVRDTDSGVRGQRRSPSRHFGPGGVVQAGTTIGRCHTNPYGESFCRWNRLAQHKNIIASFRAYFSSNDGYHHLECDVGLPHTSAVYVSHCVP